MDEFQFVKVETLQIDFVILADISIVLKSTKNSTA